MGERLGRLTNEMAKEEAGRLGRPSEEKEVSGAY